MSAAWDQSGDVLQLQIEVWRDGLNQRWSLDFVFAALTDGCRFRILVIIDDFGRENLELTADTSLSSYRVARELDQITSKERRMSCHATGCGKEAA